MTVVLPYGADALVTWEEPIDEATGTFIGGDATGTVTLQTVAGVAVDGGDGLDAVYSAGPPRRYQATIPHDVSVTKGATYYVVFTLIDADGSPVGRKVIEVISADDE